MSNINTENSKKRGLGRGLGSLLSNNLNTQHSQNPNEPLTSHKNMTSQSVIVDSQKNAEIQKAMEIQQDNKTTQVSPENRIWKIDIEKLTPGSTQPRKKFEKESIQQLALSIKENDIIQPILVRRNALGKLEIIAGERRWRAAQIAGLHQVPVIIKDIGNREALEMAIIENVQREDLNPIEEAEGYDRLIKEFNLAQQEVAQKIGKDRATIANALRLLNLPTAIREFLINGELSAGHAKVLLSLNNQNICTEIGKRCVIEKLSVRKLEKLVQEINENENAPNQKERENEIKGEQLNTKIIEGLSEEIQKSIGTKATIDYKNAKGKINIYFYSDDQLSNLVEKLRR